MGAILRTKFNLEIKIDETNYEFVFSPINKTIEKELNSLQKESLKAFEKSDELKAEIIDLKEMKSLNDEILKDENYKNKSKIYDEQKELITNIRVKEKELKELGDDRERVAKSIEEYYKKAFELCVNGEGKVALEKAVEENGISYGALHSTISQALAKAMEKK